MTSESLEADGEFWLPAEPDVKVPGILTFSQDGGGSLSLIGSLSDYPGKRKRRGTATSRILGTSINRRYTLDGCFSSSQRTVGRNSRERFHVNRIVEGVHYDADEAVEVDGLVLNYSNLLNWTSLSGVEISMKFEEVSGVRELTISSKPLDDLETEIQQGKLILRHSTRHKNEYIEGQSVSQSIEARFELGTIVAMEDAMDLASDFQDLLTIATDRVCGYAYVGLLNPDWTVDIGERLIRQSKPFYTQWTPRTDESKRQIFAHDMCFTFDELGGMQGVKSWMEIAARFRSELGRVMSTRYKKGLFLQDTLFHRVASLESFHRELKGKPSAELGPRLADLINYAGWPFLALFGGGATGRRKALKWRTKAKNERNDIAHHLGRNLRVNESEMYFVGEAAYWLFVICMLKAAGAPEDVFKRLVQSPRFEWVGENLCALF